MRIREGTRTARLKILSRSQDFVYVVDKVCIPYIKDTCSETKSYVMGVARASTIHLNGRMKEQTQYATIELK